MSNVVHVIGAAGFAGAQLADLVRRHPHFELGRITARADAGRRLVDVHPRYRVTKELTEYDPQHVRPGDFAAVAYPHAEAARVVSELIDRGARVVDISADHRLRNASQYPEWYDFEHPRTDLLAEAVYGLPERYRSQIAEARLVANPGCYPETAILGLLPLVGEIADVVVDAKSGVSGAGRTPSETVHFSSVADSVVAYKVYAHRHLPEIEQELGVEVTFTPHLVPVDRGLLATCYARLTGPPITGDELRDRSRAYYDGHPFVEVVDATPSMRAVQHTNFCQIHPTVNPRGGRVTVLSVLDNLGKGAASQALQNLNIMAGRPEDEGLR